MEQFELPLAPPESRTPLPTSWRWRYRFTNQGLVEDITDRRRVYGDWNRLFGCWEVDLESNASRELVPDWPVLGDNGVWLPQEKSLRWMSDFRRYISRHPKWRYEANIAFAAYFSAIPTRIRSLVAPLGRYQWVALDLIWQEPNFARFLDDEIHRGNAQYLFACLALGNVVGLGRTDRRAFAEAMMGEKRHVFLGKLTGRACRLGVLRVLAKLGTEPFPPRYYEDLLCFMRIPRAAKLLFHMRDIGPAQMKALDELPGDVLYPRLLTILDDERLVESFTCMLRGILLELSEKEWPRVVESLRHVRTLQDLQKWGSRWERRLARAAPLPPPPIPGDDRLRPLTTLHALRREALAMRNCLHTLEDEVLAGETYYYHWAGSEPATVMMEHVPGLGWVLAEALGADNEELGDVTLRKILDVVGVQLMRRHVRQALPGRPEEARV